jgi:outer membrane protein assembly factor BamB
MVNGRFKVVSFLVVVLIIGGLSGVLAACCPAQKYAKRTVRGTVLPIAARGDVRGSDLLITNWDTALGSETIFVTYVTYDGDKRRVVWDKDLEGCDDCWHGSRSLSDESRIYYLAGERLLALSREDGATVWEAFPSDVVSTSCEQCIWKAKGHIVVLTMDYVLQGVDAEDGDLAWSVRLNNPSAAYDGFSVIGDQVVLLDWFDAEVADKVVRVFDPASGLVLREIQPTCPDPEGPIWLDEVFIERTSGGRAVFLYNCWAEPFVQSWNLASGEEMWRAPIPEEAGHSYDSFLLGQDVLYVNTSSEHFWISLSTGQTRRLAELDPDYDVTLLAEQAGIILARARRTRGSVRYELWGLDTFGRRTWQYEMQADTLIGVDSGSADWAYRFTPDGLIVIQVLDDPEEHISATMLDPKTGEVLQDSELTTDARSLDGLAWDSAYGYLTVWGDLYTVDLQTLDIERAWP